jgi:hypothetical protein
MRASFMSGSGSFAWFRAGAAGRHICMRWGKKSDVVGYLGNQYKFELTRNHSPALMFGANIRSCTAVLLSIVLGLPADPGEFSRQASARAATQAGVGATLGLLFGALLKIALAFTMVGVFVLDRLL